MEKDKELLFKGFKTVAIAIGFIIFAPIMLTMGFKGIRLETPTLGFVLLLVGFITAIAGMYFLSKGIRYMLDYWFEK